MSKEKMSDYKLTVQFENVPVTFVNAIRRTALADIPTVVLTDIEILDNTSQLPHEMLKHRMEMLPVSVKPSDTSVIRDGKVEVKFMKDSNPRVVTTNDFTGKEFLMVDRDIGTPMLFARLRKDESLHIKAKLAISHKQSQVCVSTTKWVIDPELREANKILWLDAGKDPHVFDTTEFQKSYSRDEKGRPNKFELELESVGVLTAKEILKLTMQILQQKVTEYITEAQNNIQRSGDMFTITLDQGGHTVGGLMQEVMYQDLNVMYASYDIPHPLKKTMVLKFQTAKTPESILKTASDTINEYISNVKV